MTRREILQALGISMAAVASSASSPALVEAGGWIAIDTPGLSYVDHHSFTAEQVAAVFRVPRQLLGDSVVDCQAATAAWLDGTVEPLHELGEERLRQALEDADDDPLQVGP